MVVALEIPELRIKCGAQKLRPYEPTWIRKYTRPSTRKPGVLMAPHNEPPWACVPGSLICAASVLRSEAVSQSASCTRSWKRRSTSQPSGRQGRPPMTNRLAPRP